MKHLILTRPQRISMLQTLRVRKLQLDRAIRELEAYAAASGHIPIQDPTQIHLPTPDDASKQWLQ